MGGKHVGDVRGAASGQPPLPPAPGELDDPRAAVDRTAEAQLAGLPAADQLARLVLAVDESEASALEPVEAEPMLAPGDPHHPVLGRRHRLAEPAADRAGPAL